MARRRDDNIPSVKEYTQKMHIIGIMWYEENKYDMMYADEIIEDDDDYNYCDDCGMKNGAHDYSVEH